MTPVLRYLDGKIQTFCPCDVRAKLHAVAAANDLAGLEQDGFEQDGVEKDGLEQDRLCPHEVLLLLATRMEQKRKSTDAGVTHGLPGWTGSNTLACTATRCLYVIPTLCLHVDCRLVR